MQIQETDLKKLRDDIEKGKRDQASAETLLAELLTQRETLLHEIRAAGFDPEQLPATAAQFNTEAAEHYQRARQLLVTPAPTFKQGSVF